MNARRRPGRDVSVIATSLLWDYLESHGGDVEAVFGGLGWPLEFWQDRTNWIDLDTFEQLQRRFEAEFPDTADVFYRAGLTIASARIPFLGALARTFISPVSFYRFLPRVVPRFLFRRAQVKVDRTARSHLLARYIFEPGHAPTDAWVEINRGTLAGGPLKMGFPQPEVSACRVDPLVIEYEISLVPGWMGVGDLLQRVCRRLCGTFRTKLRSLPESRSVMLETNLLLADKVDALEVTRAALDEQVRGLTVLNAVNEVAVQELELSALLQRSVRVIRSQLNLGVALFLAEPTGYEFGASAGVAPGELQAVKLRISGMGEDTAPRFSGVFTRRAMEICPLTVRGRTLGLLVLTSEQGEAISRLVEPLAGQLSAAIDNARSYREVRQLRDHLEERVEQRTAELRCAQLALQANVKKLESADRATREFFTNMSHEFRTPLTLILAPLQKLAERLQAAQDGGSVAMVGQIQRNAESLLRHINEILDFARIDAEQMPVRPQAMELVGFLAELVDSLRPMAQRAQVELLAPLPDIGVRLYADPNLIRRAFGNLLVNAIKYIRPGDSVHLSVQPDPTGDRVRVEVVDTGPGIPPERRDAVFERFRRLDDGQGNVATGTGIGLAMVRSILELHGGSILLEGNEPSGARFIVELPMDGLSEAGRPLGEARGTPNPDQAFFAEAMVEDAPELNIPEPDRPDAPRVLVVEDNADMVRFLVGLLGPRYRVSVARDGHQGLVQARAALPDLVVSDGQMPRLDGFELCAALREDPHTAQIPVVLLTAMHDTSATVRAFEVGANDFVTKPFSPPELLARLDAQIRLRDLQLAVMRMERHTSLGMMAAGIAHEVINPVNAILTAIAPLTARIERMGARDRKVSERLVSVMASSGERIRDVVQSVLAIARHDGPHAERRMTRLGADIQAVLTVLAHRLEGVQVNVDCPPEDHVECHPELVSQVIMNLCTNSIDAMDGGGTIDIRVERQPGRIMVWVTDSGPGIPAEDRARIFTPFYTTKDPGKGTGLGLALGQEIMALHGGSLDHVPGPGATFLMVLPT